MILLLLLIAWATIEVVFFTLGLVLLLMAGAVVMLIFGATWLGYELGYQHTLRMIVALSGVAFILFVSYVSGWDRWVFLGAFLGVSFAMKSLKPDE